MSGLDPVFRKVRDAVVAAGGDRVARLIAYGSRVYGNPRPDSDLDLLIVLFERRGYELDEELRRAAEDAAPWPVSAWIASEREFEETKEIPGGMTFAPHRHGLVLYRHPASPRPYTDLRTADEARRALAAFWIRRAARFVETGRTLLAEGDDSLLAPGGDSSLEAARNARWAAEWCLRGYFTAHGIDTGKVHDFVVLREFVARQDAELARALAVADPLARYPRPLVLRDTPRTIVSEEEARDALRRAERVAELIEEQLSARPPAGRGEPEA